LPAGDLVVSVFGVSLEAALAIGYGWLAFRVSRNGKRWPLTNTAAFVSGVLVLVFSLQYGFAAHDEIFWVHVVQHLLLMCVAPALLTLGAPLMLLLRALRRDDGRRLVGALRHRWLNWMNGPSAALHLPVHYYGIMYVYLLTPAYGLSQRNELFHEFSHLYAIGCGLMFWLPVLGRHPSRWRPARRTRVRMVASGIPASVVLAALVAALAPVTAATGVRATIMGACALAIGGVAASVFGLALLRSAPTPRPRPATFGGTTRGAMPIPVTRRA
jgi:putative copper resistance protein D